MKLTKAERLNCAISLLRITVPSEFNGAYSQVRIHRIADLISFSVIWKSIRCFGSIWSIARSPGTKLNWSKLNCWSVCLWKIQVGKDPSCEEFIPNQETTCFVIWFFYYWCRKCLFLRKKSGLGALGKWMLRRWVSEQPWQNSAKLEHMQNFL